MGKDTRQAVDGADEGWLRRHALLIGVLVFGAAAMTMFTLSEWGYFKDQCHNVNTLLKASHAEPERCPSFWSPEHRHDWGYNAASNWQSEFIAGILALVLLLKLEGPRGADKDDT